MQTATPIPTPIGPMNIISQDGIPIRLTDEMDMQVSVPSERTAQVMRRLEASFAGSNEPVVTGDEVRDLLAGRVTPFELRALQAINDIPRGETRTYGQLATTLGAPGLARAVGSVCARNPLPLIIPCHRVVPAKGLGRYSGPGGETSKRLLLDLEGAI